MRKLKKAVISVGIVVTVLMTILAVSPVSAYYIGLTSTVYDESTHCGLMAYSNTAVLSATDSTYSKSLKYASCSSYSYNSSSGFIKQDTARSNYTNEIACTSYDHLLDINDSIDKTVFYGEIYLGGKKESGIIDRIWIKRYRNQGLANKD